MSWSFTVSDDEPKEAQRKFDNALADAQANIPLSVSTLLSDSAADLVNMVPNGCGLVLGSTGHFNVDGTGNGLLTFSIGKKPEWTPPGT